MAKGWSGSDRHTESAHGGKVSGTREVVTGGPGKFARSVKTTNGEYTRPTPSGATPSGESRYKAGDPPPKGFKL